MRAYKTGQPFADVQAERYVPDDNALNEMRRDLDADGPYRVFSEGHLYPRLGKDDARFVLAVAEEYTRLIEHLGPDKVRAILEQGHD